jgi:glutathione S-transferase
LGAGEGNSPARCRKVRGPPAYCLEWFRRGVRRGHRLGCLSRALGGKPFLDGERFTAGDLMMSSVPRIMPELVEEANLKAYVERRTGRPAFKRALDAQMADFRDAA